MWIATGIHLIALSNYERGRADKLLMMRTQVAIALCSGTTIYSTLLSIFNKQIEKIGKFTFMG